MSTPEIAIRNDFNDIRPAAAVAVGAPTGDDRRLTAIDVLRGAVIVLMALDHVRDYFTAVRFSPTDLAQTDIALFLTRWITHFCAPTVILLAGVGARLYARSHSKAETARFLVTRGLWLVFLEFTLVNVLWFFNFRFQFGLTMQVIWAIGMSMVVLAGLIRLPIGAIAAFAVVLIAGHNLLDGIAPGMLGAWAPLWNVLHVQGPTPFGFVAYPLVPWIGVMAAGYVLGGVYEWTAKARRKALMTCGTGALALFVLLRAFNVYGDPMPWSAQQSFAFTLLSFINVSKYPPSLQYLLATLGPALVALAVLERVRGRVADVLQTFGRVPLFAYVTHIAVAHLLAGVTALSLGFGTSVLTNFFMFLPAGWGFGLPGVYLAWIIVLTAIYPACRWFAALKRRRSERWLSYV